MKSLKISFLILLSILLVTSITYANNWMEEELPITPGSGIQTEMELELKIDPMQVSYATVVKQNKTLSFIMVLKNSTDKIMKPSLGYAFGGYHDGERIFRRGVGTGVFPGVIMPGEYFVTSANYNADDEKTISFINALLYSQDFTEFNESYSKNLKITEIFIESGMLQIEIKNTSEEEILKDTNVQLFFFNQQDQLIGWKQFWGSDPVVPGGTRELGGMIGSGAVLIEEYATYHDFVTEVEQDFVEAIHSGEIKVEATGVPTFSEEITN